MQINLLPDLVLNRRREARLKQVANLALIGWMAALVGLVVLTLGYKLFQDQSLKSAKAKHQTVDARVNSEENVAFRTEALEVQASLKALDQLFNGQRRLSTIVRRIAEVTPGDVKLGEVNIDASGLVVVNGTAASYAQAGKMVVAMRNTDQNKNRAHFVNVALGGASAAERGVAFSIRAAFVDPPVKVSAQ